MSPITTALARKQKFTTLQEAHPAVQIVAQKLTDAITLAQSAEDRTPAEKSAIASAEALLATTDDSLLTLGRANDWLAEASTALEFFDKRKTSSQTQAPDANAGPTRPDLPTLKIDRGAAITSQDFQRLSHSDRNFFMRAGGRIVESPELATTRVA